MSQQQQQKQLDEAKQHEEEESHRERNELEKSLARMRSFVSGSRNRPQTHPVQNKTQMYLTLNLKINLLTL